jgi:hypothetical protein
MELALRVGMGTSFVSGLNPVTAALGSKYAILVFSVLSPVLVFVDLLVR